VESGHADALFQGIWGATVFTGGGYRRVHFLKEAQMGAAIFTEVFIDGHRFYTLKEEKKAQRV